MRKDNNYNVNVNTPLSAGVILMLFFLFLHFAIHGQQVIIVYSGEELTKPHYVSDGRIIDFPAQQNKATLRTSSSASLWVIDSMIFTRVGVFADGFRLYVPGQWEFRDKVKKERLTHKLYYGRSEFVATTLEDAVAAECGTWQVEPWQTREILGFPCTRAVRQCDGVEQVAYFTRSVPIVDGPEYIPELPGLVLEYSDGRFHYVAASITAVEEPITPPSLVKQISKDQYSTADSRLVIDRQNLHINSWIRLNPFYWVQ